MPGSRVRSYSSFPRQENLLLFPSNTLPTHRKLKLHFDDIPAYGNCVLLLQVNDQARVYRPNFLLPRERS